MSQSLVETKSELQKILGREPTCSLLKTGKYMADYFKYGARPSEFVGDNEEEALTKLLEYLRKQLPGPVSS